MQIRGRTRLIFVSTVVIIAVLTATALSLLLTPQQANVTATSNAGEIPDLYDPALERVFAQPGNNGQEEIDLPPIVKVPPKYPNLDSNLNRLSEAASAANQMRTDDAGSGESETAEPVLVTFYVDPAQVDNVREYLEDNGVFLRNVGEDYIEAHIPPLLLPEASGPASGASIPSSRPNPLRVRAEWSVRASVCTAPTHGTTPAIAGKASRLALSTPALRTLEGCRGANFPQT